MNEELINELVRHKQEMQNDFGWNTTLQKALDAAIEVVKLIPDNATNGDVIKALFPNANIELRYWNDDKLRFKDTDFWNEPYERR